MNNFEDARVYSSADDISAQAVEARPNVEESAKATAQATAEAQAQVLVDAIRQGKMAFISPSAKTYRKLVKPGRVTACYPGTQLPIIPGAPSQNGVDMTRVGDIWATFSGGMLIVGPQDENGVEIIEWASSHPDVCRDAMDPSTETWAAMRGSQLNMADREPSLPTNIDVDAVLRGDFSGFSEFESVTQRARRMLAAQA